MRRTCERLKFRFQWLRRLTAKWQLFTIIYSSAKMAEIAPTK